MNAALRGAAALVALTAGLAALPASPAPATSTMAPVADPPNVVLILVDDARLDDITTLPKVTNRIGDVGATFNGTVSSFPLCCPARASLLTGQYPHNHEVLSNQAPLGGWSKFKDADTLATWLDPVYETGLIGKYFNEYRAPYTPPGWDYWATPRGTYNYTYDLWNINGADESLPGYQTDTMGKLAADFITERAAGTDPFFLYTSIVGPHAGSPADPDDPRMPTPNVEDVYEDTFAGMANTNRAFNEANVSDKPAVGQSEPLSEAEIASLTEVNAQRREALLSAQDAVVQIVNRLETTGELDNTYVWFVSDNGYILGEHRIRGGKLAPYEVAVRVPMMVRGPGIAPGTVVDQPSALVDFAPTVLAMTGQTSAQGPFPMDGVNLLPVIDDPTVKDHRPIVIEAGPSSPADSEYLYHGLISDTRGSEWKYVVRKTGEKELYNLTDDPAELHNVANRVAYAPVVAELQQQLDAYQWCAGSTCR